MTANRENRTLFHGDNLDFMRAMKSPRQKRMVKVCRWVIATCFVIILLCMCELPPDIDILKVVAEVPGRTSGIESEMELWLSVSPEVTDDITLRWAAKQCRKQLILPPVAPVPVIYSRGTDRQTGRQNIRLYCYRDKWSVQE